MPANPAILTWAQERLGVEGHDLAGRFPKLEAWQAGDAQPTLRQLEAFAAATYVPIGYFFLSEPPPEALPIPDFRTIQGRPVVRPSPNLLDMIYACQQRQDWYREFAQLTRQGNVAFVGTATLDTPPEQVAAEMRDKLGFDLDERRHCPTWADALRMFIQQADRAGVLVMVSGVVLSNNRRTLDPNEFRGFALADQRAPLVFINGSDTKSGQMFTLAHELAHLWLGTTALSNAGAEPMNGHRPEEVWCNKVAAELLVPLDALHEALQPNESTDEAMRRLSRRFKVSTLVVLRRLLDIGGLSRPAFEIAWAAELERLREIGQRGAGGGDFYLTTLSRVSRRFARALVESTLEGHTLYRDAFRMLGVSRTETFNNLAREAGVAM